MGEVATRDERGTTLAAQEQATFAMMIEKIAMDPSLPLERLEKMLEMKERMEDRQRKMAKEDAAEIARRAYFAAMADCQAELPVIGKTRENTHTKSKYADLAAIEEQAMPIVHKNGFGVTFIPKGAAETREGEQPEMLVFWRVSHKDGHSEEGTAAIPVDGAGMKGGTNKTATQAFGSTMTYGRRYLLCMLFNISTGDDTDGNPVEVKTSKNITVDQFRELKDTLEKAGRDEAGLLKWLKLEYLEDLPQSRFGEVMVMLGKVYAEKLAAEKAAAAKEPKDKPAEQGKLV